MWRDWIFGKVVIVGFDILHRTVYINNVHFVTRLPRVPLVLLQDRYRSAIDLLGVHPS